MPLVSRVYIVVQFSKKDSSTTNTSPHVQVQSLACLKIMYLCNGYSRCLFSSVSHLSVFMGSFDAGLVLDLAQNIFFHHVFVMHYFPSLHPILQSQGFLSIALGGYGSCIFILRNLSFPHQSRSRSFLFSACFHTSL